MERELHTILDAPYLSRNSAQSTVSGICIEFPMKRAPSVIPDVCNRESRVFPCRTFPSLGVRHRGFHYSEVMLALSKRYDSLIEPGIRIVLTGFPLKTAGMTVRGIAGMTGKGVAGMTGRGAAGMTGRGIVGMMGRGCRSLSVEKSRSINGIWNCIEFPMEMSRQ